MDNCDALIQLLLEAVRQESRKETAPVESDEIPVGISNRHVHLSKDHLEKLFGKGYELTKIKDLSQPGQFACKETVTLCGAKGAIEKVRILGPIREKTQIEILAGDSFKLGIKTQPRLSGDLEGTPGLTLVGPKGSIQTESGVMIAQRHIHMLPEQARYFGVYDGQNVNLEIEGLRGGILKNTIIRVTNTSGLECHVDTEEANAFGLNSSSKVKIIK